MAPLISFGKNRVINITVKDHVVRMAELKNNKEPHVLRSEERYLPNGIIREGKIQDSETLTAILEECISEWKIKGKEIAFLVPDPVIIIRKLSIPQDVSAEEIKGYLYMELGTSIHLPFEDPVFDYTILETGESGTKEILLFAAPEEVIHEYVSVFEEARLKPVLADISCLALYRLYYELDLIGSEENLMMVQVDIQQVNVSIFENHKPVFMRHLLMDIDSGKWELEPGNQLAYLGDKEEIISPLEDIYKELDRVMSFYRYSLHQGNRQITRVLIDGDHPWLGELHEELNSRLDAPVLLLSDPDKLREKPSFLPQFNLNVGLGLKEV
jgi:type IV pilus assembly protein PilM